MRSLLHRRTLRSRDAVEVFRPRVWLRYSVLAAIVFWVHMFFVLVALNGTSGQAFLGIGFFVTLFTALAVFYNNLSIEVTPEGLVSRGVLSFRLLRFADIQTLDVKPGLLQTTYSIRGRRSFVLFTNLFADHQRLLEIILERSELSREEVA